jgi:hypothetical protein
MLASAQNLCPYFSDARQIDPRPLLLTGPAVGRRCNPAAQPYNKQRQLRRWIYPHTRRPPDVGTGRKKITLLFSQMDGTPRK